MSRLRYFQTEIDMPAKMVKLPVRATVVRADHGVVIISPVPFTEAEAREIQALGPVTQLVSPSLIHHMFMPEAIRRFPQAQVWGTPGCREKMPEVNWSHVFTRDPWPHAGELDVEALEGMPKLNEVLFFDRPSRTLIATDFVFNLTRPKGWAAPLMLRLMGTYGHFAVSKLMNRFMKDRSRFDASVRRILDWDFDRVVMGHGDIVESGGKAKLRRALEERGFHLDSARIG